MGRVNKNQDDLSQKVKQLSDPSDILKDITLSKDIKTNLEQIKKILDKCSDVVFREFVFDQNEEIRLALIYIDGLADNNQLSDQIMRALALEVSMVTPHKEVTKAEALRFIKQRGLCIHQINETENLDEIIQAILSGDTALLVDGHSTAIINGARGWEARSITQPEIESTVRGPQESFVESIRTNTSLLRRKIKSPNLKIENMFLGTVTDTNICITYIEGIVEQKLVDEVKDRLGSIKIDGILESSYVEELINDSPRSVFPTVNHTERPDKLAAMLLEGRVGIIVDGSPFALTVPNLFMEYFQAPDDYYLHPLYASFIRPIRFIDAFLSLVLPALYIGIVSFHQELLPTSLLMSVAAQRETVPFPVLAEVLIMVLIFEVLREAGVRLPRPIGQAVSIVGALVIGDAAVSAGLTAASTVIVIAFTGITSFIFHYSAANSFRILRFILMILAGCLGLFGLTCGIAIIAIHLCTLRSFGVPYLSPLVPTTGINLYDIFFRAPWWAMIYRPRLIARQNQKRQQEGQMPKPQKNRE
jgi:spore germination protein KA